MELILILVGLLILSVVIFIVYKLLRISRQKDKLKEEKYIRVKGLFDKLQNEQPITENDFYPFAENIVTREITYNLLRENNLTEVFPKEYYSIIKGAESNLVNWLEFPTELDALPDAIEHIKRVTFDFDGQNNFVHHEVFKCKVNEPHWAAKDGWFLGVVGPYFDDSKPYDFPRATFCRISSTLNNTKPDDEAKWVHENISMRN